VGFVGFVGGKNNQTLIGQDSSGNTTIDVKMNKNLEVETVTATGANGKDGKIGINGLLRKILGVFLLMILIPMSVLLPEKTGFAFLYSIYLGYIAFTFQSLIENYRKLKGNVTLFQPILKAFQRLIEKDNDTKKGE